jgi:uncharacterized small protein (DUF1192 family)
MSKKSELEDAIITLTAQVEQLKSENEALKNGGTVPTIDGAVIAALQAEIESFKSAPAVAAIVEQKPCKRCEKLEARVKELESASTPMIPGEQYVVLANKKFRVLSIHDPKSLYDAFMKHYVDEQSTVVVVDKKPM